MSNVLSIFQEYFNRRGVKRIRFKVDPTLKGGFDIAETYEGYILKESHSCDAVLYVPVGDQMGMHNMQGIIPVPEDDRLGPIKAKIVEILKGKPGQEVLPQIMKTNCFVDIESLLRGIGMESDDIIELLKRVITNEAKFNYEGLDSQGKAVKGVIDAPDQGAAFSQLKAANILPTRLTPVPSPAPAGSVPPVLPTSGATGPIPPSGTPATGPVLPGSTSSTAPLSPPTSAHTGFNVRGNLKRVAKGIGGAIKGVAKAPFKAAEKISKGKRKLDAATRYLKSFEPGYLAKDTPKWIANPNLNARMFTSDPEFMSWYNDFGDMKGNVNAAKTILQNSSIKQLNYLARKFYESSGKYIS